MSKICIGCSEERPLKDFHKKKSSKDGYRARCKFCRSNRAPREWDSGYRTCFSCGVRKKNEEFPTTPSGSPRKVCKACANAYQCFKLTKHDIDRMLIQQNFSCAICKKDLDSGFHIDHDHSCCPSRRRTCGNCVRGLLCMECNTRLAWYEKWSTSADKYLGRIP